jgi:hypothetical protein
MTVVTAPTTTSPQDPQAWKAAVEELGLAVPEGWTVQLAEAKYDPAAWHRDAQGEEAVTRPVWRLKFRVAPSSLAGYGAEDVATMVRDAMRIKRTPRPPVAPSRGLVVAYSDPQTGKALADTTPILTDRGWITHGEVKPGDSVFGPDGTLKRVLAVTGSTVQQGHRVVFDKDTEIIATGDHLWQGYRFYRVGGSRSGGFQRERRSLLWTTEQIAAIPMQRGGSGIPTPIRSFHVDLPESLQMPDADLPVDPYLFGVWVGDGVSARGSYVGAPEDVAVIQTFTGGYQVEGGSRPDVAYIQVPGLKQGLRALGALGNKHIPAVYLESSADQRLALLQGLMDTDGTCSKGLAEFTTTLPDVAESVRWLVSSLGMKAKTFRRDPIGLGKKEVFRISFRPDRPVFRLHRKLARQSPVDPGNQARYRQVQRVEPVGEVSAQCLTVEGGLYLAGRDMVITHNCDRRGGTPELIARIAEKFDRLQDHVRDLKTLGRPVDSAYWMDAGDCVEGQQNVASQLATNDLTMTEMVRLHRRLTFDGLSRLARQFDSVTAAVCASNHAQHRINGKVVGPPSDDWGIETMQQVADAFNCNPDSFGHVKFILPEKWEETVSVDVAGTVVGLSHGHQVRGPGKVVDWWRGQTFGEQPVAAAKILLTGHFHHFRAEEVGSGKLWVQAPALDNGSSWYANRTGDDSRAGLLVFSVGADGWSDLVIL